MVRKSPEGVLAQCAPVHSTSMAETAFANACDLLLADGGIEEEEKVFLDSLQKHLGISGDQTLTIVEVMIIKNRG